MADRNDFRDAPQVYPLTSCPPQVVCDGPGSLRYRHPHRPAGHQRLERPGSRPQEVVPVPHQHPPRAHQGDQRGRRQPAGRGYHLVQRGLSPNAAAQLVSRVQTARDPPETRGDGFCAWSVKRQHFLNLYLHGKKADSSLFCRKDDRYINLHQILLVIVFSPGFSTI